MQRIQVCARCAFELNEWCANAWPPRFCQNSSLFHSILLCIAFIQPQIIQFRFVHISFVFFTSSLAECCFILCMLLFGLRFIPSIFLSAVHLLTMFVHFMNVCELKTLHHDALENTLPHHTQAYMIHSHVILLFFLCSAFRLLPSELYIFWLSNSTNNRIETTMQRGQFLKENIFA